MEENVINWFKNKEITILNIYILSLILIEQNHIREKSKIIPHYINYILDTLMKKKIIFEKEDILKTIEEEKETLKIVGETVIKMCNEPNLIQKDKFIKRKRLILKSKNIFQLFN